MDTIVEQAIGQVPALAALVWLVWQFTRAMNAMVEKGTDAMVNNTKVMASLETAIKHMDSAVKDMLLDRLSDLTEVEIQAKIEKIKKARARREEDD